MDAAEKYARQWAAVEEVDVECLSDWLSKVRDKLKSRISHLRSHTKGVNTYSVLDDPSVKACLDALHNEYVVVPADKASNNIIFVCRNYYIQCIIYELNLHSDKSNTTYTLSSLTDEDIFFKSFICAQ